MIETPSTYLSDRVASKNLGRGLSGMSIFAVMIAGITLAGGTESGRNLTLLPSPHDLSGVASAGATSIASLSRETLASDSKEIQATLARFTECSAQRAAGHANWTSTI